MSASERERDEILAAVLEEVSPSDEEREALREAYEAVRERARKALDEEGVDGEVTLVGSAARDTWLSGDRDIDVFLLLPPELDRDEFESVGLDVGKEVFPDGTVEYAEHPYVRGEEVGYDVDIVPCYDLDSTDELRSAVDRTPFHNEYIKEADLNGDEVRLLKAFARGAGVYGSDLRTRGFSGYLCELLVLHYGGFSSVVEAAADWNEGTVIDIEGHGEEEFDDPLVVIDPTDTERNVAAVLSRDSFAAFVDWCRRWERESDESLFYPEEPAPMSSDDLVEVLDERGTELVCVTFEAPDVVDDQLYPQLEKTEASLVEELERRGFDVLRSTVAADGSCLILLEFNVAEQSSVEKHLGPPVYVRKHAESFREKYEDNDEVVGPYIEDGRYVVERRREHSTARGYVESDEIFDLSIGKHVRGSMEDGYEVRSNEECTALLEEFGVEFARYFAGN